MIDTQINLNNLLYIKKAKVQKNRFLGKRKMVQPNTRKRLNTQFVDVSIMALCTGEDTGTFFETVYIVVNCVFNLFRVFSCSKANDHAIERYKSGGRQTHGLPAKIVAKIFE